MDALAALSLRSGRVVPRLFSDGWGDEVLIARYSGEARTEEPVPDLRLVWRGGRRDDGLFVWDAIGASPAPDLPDPARRLSLRLISPFLAPDRVCLLAAAFNDHGFESRSKLATVLARHGIASLLFENPLYGSRRADHRPQAIRSVSDLLVMGHAATLEGRAILASLHERGIPRLGVSGYSMGGNIAALIAATVPFPVAVAPLAPSHSPGPVYTQGVLSRTVAWERLGGTAARGRLAAILGSASVLHYPAPAAAHAAVLVAGRSDGYIPRHAVLDLHRHWPGSEMRWLTGGHISVFVLHRSELARAVADSFRRLSGCPPGGASGYPHSGPAGAERLPRRARDRPMEHQRAAAINVTKSGRNHWT